MNVSALVVTPLEPLLPAFTRRSWDAAKNVASIRGPRRKTAPLRGKTRPAQQNRQSFSTLPVRAVHD
jgi:hypothetical protein